MTDSLKPSILNEAHRLGFILAGVTTPDPPPHIKFFKDWLAHGHHADMAYLATDRARTCRADPRLLLPECKSILVLGVPYNRPTPHRLPPNSPNWGGVTRSAESVASYAIGEDYHLVLPPRLTSLVQFIETQVGHPIPNRYYTDTGPLLERDLAQRAGLGWIGKNTCLIHPQKGSYFLLAEILLGLELEPGTSVADHCGTCTRCIEACPTRAVLPNRSLDARRCISYLTIENKGDIPEDLRSLMQNWIFGCDICQTVCPWNRFSAPEGDASFQPSAGAAATDLLATLAFTPQSFNRQFKRSPIQRAKRRGLLRNASVALGNLGDEHALPVLENVLNDSESLIRGHAQWAISQIVNRKSKMKLLLATNNKGKLRELQAILADLPIELAIPADIHLELNVEEDGVTYAENAAKKAVAFARASGLTCLADDSGLEVDALDGAPGLYSARYGAPPSPPNFSEIGESVPKGRGGLTDADRRAYLLQKLDGKPRPWAARFRATVAVAGPDGGVQIAEGICEGEIIPEERGAGGFGYDPIFFMPELGQTMAELSEETKNRLSHRARAVEAAKPILMKLFGW